MKMNKTLKMLITIMIFTICLSGCGTENSALTPDKGASYFIYIGLADAETGEQLLSMEEALPLVQESLAQEKQGATVLPSWGGFVGEDGTYNKNETVLVITTADESMVSMMVEKWQESLQVACIYVERYDIQHGIYGGIIM